MLLALLAYVAVAIPASIALGRIYGPSGCWMGLAAGFATVSLLLLARLMVRARSAPELTSE